LFNLALVHQSKDTDNFESLENLKEAYDKAKKDDELESEEIRFKV